MKKRSTSNELQDLIKQLTTIRKEHVRALEEIENTFRMFGLDRLLKESAGKKRGPKKGGGAKATATASTASKRGGKKAAAKAPKAKASKTKATKAKAPKAKAPKTTKATKGSSKARGSFEITGDELILRFVKAQGGATTEQIRKHWEAQGRGGKSDNNLTNLVKSGKLDRNKDPNGAGSLYTTGTTAPATTTTPSA